MALRYFLATVTIGRKKLNYYVEADQLMSEPDIKDKLSHLASMDFLVETDEEDYEYEELSVDISLEEIDHDKFLFDHTLPNTKRLRTELCCSMLTDPSDVIYSFIRIFNSDLDDSPYGLLVTASCNQDADINYIGVVNQDGKSYQDIVQEGQRDCMMQLRRYFTVDGVSLRRGVLLVAVVPPDEYEEIRQERELALAI